MQLHWEHTYDLELNGEKRHELKIYRFSPKALFLSTTENFNTAFHRYFEEVGGAWNNGLKFEDDSVKPGWLFPLEEEIQTKLFDLLKKIHSGDIPPIVSEFKHLKADEDMKNMCSKIFNDLSKIFELIPQDEKDSFSIPHLSEGGRPEGETIFYFNRAEGERAKGSCVITLEKNRKRLEIFQYMYC